MWSDGTARGRIGVVYPVFGQYLGMEPEIHGARDPEACLGGYLLTLVGDRDVGRLCAEVSALVHRGAASKLYDGVLVWIVAAIAGVVEDRMHSPCISQSFAGELFGEGRQEFSVPDERIRSTVLALLVEENVHVCAELSVPVGHPLARAEALLESLLWLDSLLGTE